jgi:hypothetical protein
MGTRMFSKPGMVSYQFDPQPWECSGHEQIRNATDKPQLLHIISPRSSDISIPFRTTWEAGVKVVNFIATFAPLKGES